MSFHRGPDAMRRFYDGFHRWYGFIEGNTERSVLEALEAVDPHRSLFAGASVLEHCCGSGSFGLAIAGRCGSYEGRDQSEGMLRRARARWSGRFGAATAPPFALESVLAPSALSSSYDWTAIAFALHLFPPEEERDILASLLRIARRGVLVIDHATGFSPLLSLVEALEGSWYGAYRGIDFAALARGLDASLVEMYTGSTKAMLLLKGTTRTKW